MKLEWSLVLGGAAFVVFLLGGVVGMVLSRYADMRDTMTYIAMHDSLRVLDQEVKNCRYHANRANGRMSLLESDVAAALRGRR